MKAVKIAIIGANSFLARNFIKYLIDHESTTDVALYGSHEQHLDGYQNYRQINIENIDSLLSINFNVDVVYIFSGKTGPAASLKDYGEFIRVNEIGLLNIIQVYLLGDARPRIVYPSSRLVYKSSDSFLVEDDPKELCSVYAVTKFAAENYLEIYSKCYALRFCILRICTPFGSLLESERSYGTISIFENQVKQEGRVRIFGEGGSAKTYTHVYDICRIFFEAALNEEMENGVFNIGGSPVSLLAIAENIAKKDNVDVTHTPWPHVDHMVDGGQTILDASKLDRVLDINYHRFFSSDCEC